MNDNTKPPCVRLKKLAYTEYAEKSNAWKFDCIEFFNINLIVGKNATGKSRVLRVINGLANLINNSLKPENIASGQYVAEFEIVDRDITVKYEFEIYSQKIRSEKLEVNGEIKLDRKQSGPSQLHFEKHQGNLEVEVPVTYLAAASRRDSIQHPYFEYLHLWAKSVKYFESSKIDVGHVTAFDGKLTPESIEKVPFQNRLHVLVKFCKERFPHVFEAAVISDMRKLGYEIEELGLMPEKGISIPIINGNATQVLYVIEKGISGRISQKSISNGMLRAISTLVFLHSTRLQKHRDLILIDDIGEGLDFDRSSKLIALLIDEAEKGFIQLTMTTNDRFIMNAVPLKYWSILRRDLGIVSIFNHLNSKDSFDQFELHGFNNFDFFSRGYFEASTGEGKK